MTRSLFSKLSILTVTAASIALMGTVASAQPFQFKSSQSGWNIFVNEATQGCFMERESAQGIVMQVGTEAAMVGTGLDDTFGFLAIYVPGERPVDVNPTEVVVINIGQNTYFGTAATVTRDGYYGGVVISKDPTLEYDLRERLKMEILSSSGTQVIVNLAALKIGEALGAVRDCQREITG